MHRKLLPAVVAGLGMMIAAPLQAFDADEAPIASAIGGGIGSAVSDFGNLTVASMEASAEIEAARRQYWQLYPDKPGFDEATAHFANVLWQKDQLYMIGFLMEGVPPDNEFAQFPSLLDILEGRAKRLPTDHRNLAGLLLGLAGGVDGGIDPSLSASFFNWVRAVRRGMGATRDDQFVFLDPVRYPGALQQAEEEYLAYARRRDVREYFIGPRSPLYTDDPRQFLANVLFLGYYELVLPRPESLEQAYEWVDQLQALVGADAVKQVMLAPRYYRNGDAYMPGSDPSVEIGLHYYNASSITDNLFKRLRETEPDNARHWLGTLYVPGHWADLPRAQQTMEAFLNEHGEQRILAAAERLRQIGKYHMDPDALADYSGHRPEPIRWWLERLLANPDFQLPTINRPIVIDARDKPLMEKAVTSPAQFHIVGTVSTANWRTTRDGVRYFDLHVEGADHFRYTIIEHHTHVRHVITGMNGEHVVGRRIMVRGSSGTMQQLDDGVIVAQILWPTGPGPEAIIAFLDEPVPTVSELPPGIATQIGARVPWAEGTPDWHAQRTTAHANLRAYNERISRFFGDNFAFAVALDDYTLQYQNVGVGIAPTPEGYVLHVNTRIDLTGNEPTEPPNRAPLALRNQYLGEYRQRVLYHDLNWEARSLERNDHGVLVMRVPTVGGNPAVAHSSSNPTDPAVARAYLEIVAPSPFAADRIAALFDEYLAAGAAGWTQPPPTDAPHALALLQAERTIDYDGMRVQFTGGEAEVAELRAAAEAGHVHAMLLLGELIGQGHVEGGAAEAVQWFTKGHRAGNVACSARLALHLLMGRGVEADDPRRKDRYIHQLTRRAANGRDPLGMYLYAECLAKGIGGTANPTRARQFYVDSAVAGNPLARQWCQANNVPYADSTSDPAYRDQVR